MQVPENGETGLSEGLLNSNYQEGPLSEGVAGCRRHFSNLAVVAGARARKQPRILAAVDSLTVRRARGLLPPSPAG